MNPADLKAWSCFSSSIPTLYTTSGSNWHVMDTVGSHAISYYSKFWFALKYKWTNNIHRGRKAGNLVLVSQSRQHPFEVELWFQYHNCHFVSSEPRPTACYLFNELRLNQITVYLENLLSLFFSSLHTNRFKLCLQNKQKLRTLFGARIRLVYQIISCMLNLGLFSETLHA